MWWLVAIAVAGCGRIGFAPVSDAGSDALVLGPFGSPVLVTAVSTTAGNEEEPSFTADRLELIFRRGNTPNRDLFVSRRATITDPWGPPAAIVELNTVVNEQNPGISADGLTLWFSSDRAGGLGAFDLWVSTRRDRSATWSAPNAVPSLNGPSNDRCPAVSADGAVMIFTSGPNGSNDIFAALRATSTTWMPPQPIAELNTAVDDGNGLMWGSSLHIAFSSERAGTWDLWMAARPTVDDPFTDLVQVVELNSTATDWDPWISEDGRYLMFGSNRSGNQEIYETSR